MQYGVTFNQLGQPLPPGLHIPQNFANLPYVPHPLMVTGHIPFIPVLGQKAPVSPSVTPSYAATTAVNPGPHAMY